MADDDDDNERICNNGNCKRVATWIATRGHILLLACDPCKNDENAAAFDTSFRRIETP